MSPVHHSITHKALHAEYVRANVLEKKQMCRLIHPSITAAECIVFITTIEDQLCDADPLGGPNTCCHFETERKSQERDHVLVEDKDLSEARTEAAADHSYKLTTALAIAKGVLPDGAVATIVPQGKLAWDLNSSSLVVSLYIVRCYVCCPQLHAQFQSRVFEPVLLDGAMCAMCLFLEFASFVMACRGGRCVIAGTVKCIERRTGSEWTTTFVNIVMHVNV
jgi:hypothetical protein